MADGAIVSALVPWAVLVARGVHVGVLRHPQLVAACVAHDGLAQIDQAFRADAAFDYAAKLVNPRRILPRFEEPVLLALPVKAEDCTPDVCARHVEHVVGFGCGVSAARVMVDAKCLASRKGCSCQAPEVRVRVGRALCALHDHEIARHHRRVDARIVR